MVVLIEGKSVKLISNLLKLIIVSLRLNVLAKLVAGLLEFRHLRHNFIHQLRKVLDLLYSRLDLLFVDIIIEVGDSTMAPYSFIILRKVCFEHKVSLQFVLNLADLVLQVEYLQHALVKFG